jgi:hypothetical protein
MRSRDGFDDLEAPDAVVRRGKRKEEVDQLAATAAADHVGDVALEVRERLDEALDSLPSIPAKLNGICKQLSELHRLPSRSCRPASKVPGASEPFCLHDTPFGP